MSKLIGNQEFNGDIYVKGVGGYDGTNATESTVETIQTVLNTYVDTISAHTENETIHITAEERATWNSKTSSVQADWNTTATTDASYIKNKPTIPTVPTSNTAFTNDAGYITGYTETDPTVPAWAKASSKPTYTASEVGALPTGTTLDDVADGTTRKLSNYATNDTVNTLNNAVTAHTADTTIHVTSAEKSTWSGKQDTISDLAEIRTNAASGMSAYNDVNALSAATIALSAATVTLSSSTNTDIQVISANTIELSSATVALSAASEDFFDGAEYISSAKTIVFKNGNVEKASIDATEFIKDGMVSAVTISGGSMIISFNTDAGREDIALELTDIFNPDNYYTKDDINNGVSASTLELSAGTISELAKKSNTGHTHAIGEVNGLQSALDGKSDTGHTHDNYATTEVVNALNNTVTAHTANTEIHVTTAQTAAWDNKQDAISDIETIRSNAEAGAAKVSNVQADWNTTATTDESYIKNKPTIPTVPTSNTAFTNDAGYITGYTETDPTVSEWAKAPNKPAYTASEVGALPTGTTLDDVADGTSRKLSNYATTDTVNTLNDTVTAHTADTTIHVTTAQTSAWDGKQDAISDLETIRSNAEAGAAKVSNVQSDWDATTGLAVILNKPTIPSAPGTLTTTATTAQSTEISEALTGNISLHKVSKTGSYDDLTNKPTIPTVPTSNTAFTNDAGYITGYTETDPTVPTWAKAASKPSYTANEVGALPTGTTLDDIADGTNRKLSNYATTANLNDLSGGTTAHTANTAIHVTATEKSTWDGKQDAISDLATIRSNAASGMSAYNDVNALSAATISELAKKSNTGHTHAISDITNLQTALDGKSDTSHTHSDYATTGNVNTLSSATQSIQSSAQTAYDARITGGTITSGATNNVTVTNNRVAITAATIPSYSSADNGKVLMVQDGVPQWVTPSTITYSSSAPTGGNDGDIWVQTS